MYVAEDVFRETVSTLADLQRTGSVRFLTRAGGWIQFEFNRDDPRAEEFRQHPGFDNAILDLTDVIAAMIAGVSVEAFVDVRTDPDRWEDGEVEEADVARRKYLRTGDYFDLADLRRRAWLKATSKTLVPSSFEWEVVVKHGAEGVREDVSPGPVPFATIKLAGESVRPREPVTALTMTVDGEDVAYLLDALTRLRDALSELDATTVSVAENET